MKKYKASAEEILRINVEMPYYVKRYINFRTYNAALAFAKEYSLLSPHDGASISQYVNRFTDDKKKQKVKADTIIVEINPPVSDDIQIKDVKKILALIKKYRSAIIAYGEEQK